MLEIADLSRTVIGLGFVLLLMAAVFWLLRRFGPLQAGGRSTAGRRLSLVESLPLDPRTRLVLVRHDGAELLLAVTAQGSVGLLQTPAGRGAGGPNQASDAP